MKRLAVLGIVLSLTTFASIARAQEMPAAYKQVLDTLGKTGDFKDNVLKVNIPRNDLSVTVANVKTPTPFGFGGWVAMTKGTGGMDVMMGDLVLTQDEVNPVMSALLENGIDVTALHNHFLWDEPRMYYMHVHAHGKPADLAREVQPVLKALRKNGLDVVAIHHHMTGTQPKIYFLHYWGTGPAEKLATGFKAAVSETAKAKAPAATKQ